jgi:hypothetical protein
VTIWNVRASRAAALRAEEAANQARHAIRFFDVVAEISTAIAAMEEIRRLHRDAALGESSRSVQYAQEEPDQHWAFRRGSVG